MDFEFNKRQCTPNLTPADADCSGNGITPIRSVGDLLVIYDLSQGGTHPTLSLREWTGRAWGDPSGPHRLLQGAPARSTPSPIAGR